MREYWFDARYLDVGTGAVIDDADVIPRIEASDETAVYIGDLLVSRKFPFSRDDFKGDEVGRRREVIAGWGKPESLAYGRWARELVELDPDSSGSVTSKHFRRLEVMGLGLSPVPMQQRIGATSMAGLREAIGAPVGRRWGEYAWMSPEDYAEFALKVSLTRVNGRRPEEKDYDAAAADGEGPSLHVIRRSRIHSIGQLNELIGFPYVEGMTPLDMVHWGSQVRRANGGMRLTTIVAHILSGRQRGPTVRTIYSNFPSWKEYVAQVNELYDLETAWEEQQRKTNLEKCGDMITAGNLPPETTELSETELLALGGKYRVIDELVPSMSQHRKLTLARNTSNSYISELRNARPKLSPGMIERKAVSLGVFDDIWPLDDGLHYLAVTEEELRAARDMFAGKQRARKEALGAAALIRS